MKSRWFVPACGAALLMMAGSAPAQISLNLGLGGYPCAYPNVGPGCPYYPPPVGVYFGGGDWGGDRGWHGDRGERRGRGGPERGGPGHGGGGHPGGGGRHR